MKKTGLVRSSFSLLSTERIVVCLSAEKTVVFQANESGYRYPAQNGRKRSGLPAIAIQEFVNKSNPRIQLR